MRKVKIDEFMDDPPQIPNLPTVLILE
jgi:hypothetical protein